MVLDGSSSATPVKLYDGGDLGISDCKRMKLSYLSWYETATFPPILCLSYDSEISRAAQFPAFNTY